MTPAVKPYVGLRPFDRADSRFFFGRRRQTAELLQRLHETRFLGVVGSSGCGKSSLIRAGLIPALLAGFLVEERDRWRIAVLRPEGGPVAGLAGALVEAFGDRDPGPPARLAAALVEGHTEAVLDFLRPRLDAASSLLVLVDQFEEIFSFRGRQGEELLAGLPPARRQAVEARHREAADFVGLLLELAEQRQLPVYVTLTMRSDFLGDCDLFYGLPEAMNRGRYLVPRLTREQLREATEGPALLAGAALSPRLLDRLLNDLGTRSDRLPVLQHALLRTWDQWQSRGREGEIDLAHYQAAGGLDGALSQHAEEAVRTDDLTVTARVFQCLTDTDSQGRRVRRAPAPRLSELAAASGAGESEVRAVLERFRSGDRNFVVLTGTGDPQVGLCHESLIRRWPRLAGWVDEERRARDRYRELAERAHREGRGEGGLLQGIDLALADEWWRSFGPTPGWAARYSRDEGDFGLVQSFLDRSRKTAEEARRQELEAAETLAAERARAQAESRRAAQEARVARRLRRLSAALIALLVVAAAATGVAFVSSAREGRAREQAEQARREAEAGWDLAQEALEGERQARQDAEDRLRLAGDLAETQLAAEYWKGLYQREVARRGSGALAAQQVAQEDWNQKRGEIESRPRVYLHIRSEGQRERANQIGERLEAAGFAVPGVERLVDTGPDRSEVRFFHAEDLPGARKLIEQLAQVGIQARPKDLSGRYKVEPGHYEIWLAPETREPAAGPVEVAEGEPEAESVPQPIEGRRFGRVESVRGEVFALRGEQRVPLGPGEAILLGDRIHTGDLGEVSIDLGQRGTLTLWARSAVVVGKDGEPQLLRGRASVTEGRERRILTIRTPARDLSSRG